MITPAQPSAQLHATLADTVAHVQSAVALGGSTGMRRALLAAAQHPPHPDVWAAFSPVFTDAQAAAAGDPWTLASGLGRASSPVLHAYARPALRALLAMPARSHRPRTSVRTMALAHLVGRAGPDMAADLHDTTWTPRSPAQPGTPLLNRCIQARRAAPAPFTARWCTATLFVVPGEMCTRVHSIRGTARTLPGCTDVVPLGDDHVQLLTRTPGSPRCTVTRADLVTGTCTPLEAAARHDPLLDESPVATVSASVETGQRALCEVPQAARFAQNWRAWIETSPAGDTAVLVDTYARVRARVHLPHATDTVLQALPGALAAHDAWGRAFSLSFGPRGVHHVFVQHL